MALWLRQSTATTVLFGPFVEATDGYTYKATTITIASGAIKVRRANDGGTVPTGIAGAVSLIVPGWAILPIAATDAAQLGPLQYIIGNVTGNIPVWADFMVLSPNVYDSLVPGTDFLQVDVQQVTGAAPSNAAFLVVSNVNVGAIAAGVGVNVSSINTAVGVNVSSINAGVGVNASSINGGAATNIMFNANLIQILASAVTPTVAQLGVNVVLVTGAAPSNAAFLVPSTVNANAILIGGATPTNVMFNANLIQILASAVSPSLAQLGVNVEKINELEPSAMAFLVVSNVNVGAIAAGVGVNVSSIAAGVGVNVTSMGVGVNVSSISTLNPTDVTFNANVVFCTGAAPSTAIPNYLLDYIMATPGLQSITVKDYIKVIGAAVAGKCTGATGAAMIFLGPSGESRVSGTFVSGNRTGATWVTG